MIGVFFAFLRPSEPADTITTIDIDTNGKEFVKMLICKSKTDVWGVGAAAHI